MKRLFCFGAGEDARKLSASRAAGKRTVRQMEPICMGTEAKRKHPGDVWRREEETHIAEGGVSFPGCRRNSGRGVTQFVGQAQAVRTTSCPAFSISLIPLPAHLVHLMVLVTPHRCIRMRDFIVLVRHLEFPELEGSGKVPNSVITQVNEQVAGRPSEEGQRE